MAFEDNEFSDLIPTGAREATEATAVLPQGDPEKKKPVVVAPDNEFADLVPKQDSSSSSTQNEFDDLIPKRPVYMDPSRMSATSPHLTRSIEAALHPKPNPVPVGVRPMVAAADAARVRADRPEPTEHLPGQSGSLPEDVMESAGEMVTHPGQVAKGLILPPFELGGALANWKDSRSLPQAKQVLIKTLQTAAIGGSAGAEAALTRLVGGAAARLLVGVGAGATFTPERPALGAIMGAGAAAVHAVPEMATDAARAVAGDPFKGAVEAGANALRPSGPPVDQPQPLTREQQILRARLETEGVRPAAAITRRPAPPPPPPPVEPPPDAEAFSSKNPNIGRRPAGAPPVPERRAEPEAPRVTWTPEERARYITAQQKAYAAGINKPWSQWTPAEKAGFFNQQARLRIEAPWHPPVAPTEAGPAPEPAAATTPTEPVTWPPPVKEGDLTPVASANGEFATRPGIMGKVNREKPALPSPLRLPEPTPEDRAIVQPKGVKEISPEEVAARKPAPEPVTATPRQPQPATVDENGLFFEHRAPSGGLRPFNRVSTEGLIKAHREMQDQIIRDQQLAIYRNIENENMSGTGDVTRFQAATKTARGTSQQAEAAERLRNYQKVMDRLDAELKNRGLSSEDVLNRINDQEEMEAALEHEAVHHADTEAAADDAFGDFGDMVPEEEQTTRNRKIGDSAEKPISDILNVAKLNLGSKTAEQRMAAKLEEFRGQREANKQTFGEADVNRAEILNELRAGDPLALPTEKAKKLSGEELLARRDLVRENDQTIAELSKRMETGMPPEAYQQAAQLVQRAVDHNDALLSDLVTGSSQKGRDLNLLRRMANQSLDPAVWRVQAKRMLGDRPLTAEIDATIRKLAQEAEDACQ